VEKDAGADIDHQKDDGKTAADADHTDPNGVGDGVDCDRGGAAGGGGESTTIKGSEEGGGEEERQDTNTKEGVVKVGAGLVEGELHNTSATSHECRAGDEEEVEEGDADDGGLEETEIAAAEKVDGEDDFDDIAAGDDDEISEGLSAVESELLTSVFEEFGEGDNGDERNWENDKPILTCEGDSPCDGNKHEQVVQPGGGPNCLQTLPNANVLPSLSVESGPERLEGMDPALDAGLRGEGKALILSGRWNSQRGGVDEGGVRGGAAEGGELGESSATSRIAQLSFFIITSLGSVVGRERSSHRARHD